MVASRPAKLSDHVLVVVCHRSIRLSPRRYVERSLTARPRRRLGGLRPWKAAWSTAAVTAAATGPRRPPGTDTNVLAPELPPTHYTPRATWCSLNGHECMIHAETDQPRHLGVKGSTIDAALKRGSRAGTYQRHELATACLRPAEPSPYVVLDL